MGLANDDPSLAPWSALLTTWFRGRGVIEVARRPGGDRLPATSGQAEPLGGAFQRVLRRRLQLVVRLAEHDVDVRRQLTELRTGEGLEVHEDGLQRFRVVRFTNVSPVFDGWPLIRNCDVKMRRPFWLTATWMCGQRCMPFSVYSTGLMVRK